MMLCNLTTNIWILPIRVLLLYLHMQPTAHSSVHEHENNFLTQTSPLYISLLPKTRKMRQDNEGRVPVMFLPILLCYFKEKHMRVLFNILNLEMGLLYTCPN